MDEETRAAFDRIDRWFELSQLQFTEFRDEMRTGLAGFRTELRAEIAQTRDELREEIRAGDEALRNEIRAGDEALRAEFLSFRDWVSGAIAELRTHMRRVLVRLDQFEDRLPGQNSRT